VADPTTLAVYGRLVGARVRSDLQYRTSFFLFLAGQTLVTGVEFASIAVLFVRLQALAGWSIGEVAFLWALSSLAFGIGDLFISQVELVSVHIKAGTFDAFLVRPLGALLQLSAMEFAPRRLGRSIEPAIVLVVVITRLDVDWTPAHVLLVPLTLASGVAIYGSIWVLTSSLAFWTVETQEIANAFTYGGNTLTSYPIDVFGTVLRRIVVFVVPLAFVAYLPAVELLDKPMPFGLPRAVAWMGPLVAVIAVACARAVWKLAIRHYRSTGS
jgi:ABC-2 type transport system permease protein